MSIGDFHLHSTASDGVQSPTWVVETAAANGVRVLALTDHDTTAGLDEAKAAADRLGLRMIPGIELSADLEFDGLNADVHLLGFGFDVTSKPLQDQLDLYRRGRRERLDKTVDVLAGLGMLITVERVLEIAGEASVGRPHVARALVEAGYVTAVHEAFDQWLGNGKVADIPREKLSPQDAIQMVHDAGGVVFAAHPVFITPDYAPVLREMTRWGTASIDGIETYYKHYGPETVGYHAGIAAASGLAASGGSDYHGLGNPDDREIGDVPFPHLQAREFVSFIERTCSHPRL